MKYLLLVLTHLAFVSAVQANSACPDLMTEIKKNSSGEVAESKAEGVFSIANHKGDFGTHKDCKIHHKNCKITRIEETDLKYPGELIVINAAACTALKKNSSLTASQIRENASFPKAKFYEKYIVYVCQKFAKFF